MVTLRSDVKNQKNLKLDEWEKAVVDLFLNAANSLDFQNPMARFLHIFVEMNLWQ